MVEGMQLSVACASILSGGIQISTCATGYGRGPCLGEGGPGSSAGGLGDLVGFEGAADAVGGEEEDCVMVHDMCHLLHGVILAHVCAAHSPAAPSLHAPVLLQPLNVLVSEGYGGRLGFIPTRR